MSRALIAADSAAVSTVEASAEMASEGDYPETEIKYIYNYSVNINKLRLTWTWR